MIYSVVLVCLKIVSCCHYLSQDCLLSVSRLSLLSLFVSRLSLVVLGCLKIVSVVLVCLKTVSYCPWLSQDCLCCRANQNRDERPNIKAHYPLFCVDIWFRLTLHICIFLCVILTTLPLWHDFLSSLILIWKLNFLLLFSSLQNDLDSRPESRRRGGMPVENQCLSGIIKPAIRIINMREKL